MGRRSSIERLPREVHDLCLRLIRQGETIPRITEKLNELDAGVSQSAVGRYVKGAREQMERYREAQEISGQWLTELGENPKGDLGSLLGEMLKVVAFQTLSRFGEQDGKDSGDGKGAKAPKPMDIMLLAKAIRDIEATSKASIERREKIEQIVIERAAKKTGEVGERMGLSQATIDEIQKELRLL
jgi:hypothetical protein